MINLILRFIILLLIVAAELIFFTGKIFSQSAWVTQSSGTTSNINTVYFININEGFCAGDGGLLLKTTNSGLNWFPINSPAYFNFNYIKFFGNDSAVLCDESRDSIYFTTNGGTNWYLRDVNTAYYSYYRHIDFLNFNTGYYFSGGHMYRTTNNGISWTDTYSTIGIKHFSFANELTGWSAGTNHSPVPPPNGTNYAELRKTTNGGINWLVLISIQEQSYSIYRVFFKDVNTGFYNDFSNSSLKKTINGGTNFSGTTNSGDYKNYYAMQFPSNNIGWFLGDQIIKTSDGGTNWINITNTPISPSSFNGVYFVNDSIGWLVGMGGTIIKTVTGGVTSVNSISSEVPTSFSLGQNYPNPFNPLTIIRFNIPERFLPGARRNDRVVLKVFDVMGREVETLVNERLQAGSYEVTFDGSRLTSGVYFYRMVTEGYVETRRMIILK